MSKIEDVKDGIIKKNNTVVKHNDLIYMPYKLGINELKILNWIISLVNPMNETWDKHFHTYRLKIKDIHELLWFKSKWSLDDIKEAIKWLMTVEVEWFSNGIQIGKIEWWIDNTRYVYSNWYGYFDVKLNDSLWEYLLWLEWNYGDYKLNNAISLQNPYSYRLYEILNSILGKDKWKKVIKLDQLRKILKLWDKYPLFANFKVKVLEVIQKEINEKTDILISYKPDKEGRKVTGVEFKVTKNNKSVSLLTPIKDMNSWIENKLLWIWMKWTKIDELLLQYWEDKLKNTYSLLSKEIKKWRIIKNPPGWITSALLDNYNEVSEVKNNIVEYYKEQSNIEDDKRKEENKKIAQYKKEFNQWFNWLSDDRRNDLIEKYKKWKAYLDKDLLIKSRISTDYKNWIIN